MKKIQGKWWHLTNW